MTQKLYRELINTPNLILELIQRSKYEIKPENKILAIYSLCELVRFMPDNLVVELLNGYSEYVQVLVSSFSLYLNDLLVQVLKVIAKIVIIDETTTTKRVKESSIMKELDWLVHHEKKQVLELALQLREIMVNK